MTISWKDKKKYNPIPVINKMEASRTLESDGKAHFEAFGFMTNIAIIYSMLNFSKDTPENEGRDLVRRAVVESGSEGPVTPESILEAVNKLDIARQSQPAEKYVLVTSISMNPPSKRKKIRIDNTTITFDERLPVKFQKEFEEISKNFRGRLFAELPTNYSFVRVYTLAKSSNQAGNQALDTLDFVRGMLNWINNMRYPFRFSGGKPKPVNKIILGPVHTLHQPSGKPAGNVLWWEESYLGAVTPIALKTEEWNKVYKLFESARKAFKRHSYAERIRNAFIRYARALDENVGTTAYLKLWNVLELLTVADTAQLNYDDVKKRVAFLYKNREYHKQVLEHLRDYRNAAVHSDSQNSEMETYLYQLKNYVEYLFHFHLRMYRFDSFSDAIEFLNLPHEDKILRSQIEKRTLARKYHGYT